jgi:hypothetical protein
MKPKEIKVILKELLEDSIEKRKFFESLLNHVREVFLSIQFFTEFAEDDDSAVLEELLGMIDSAEESERFLKGISEFSEMNDTVMRRAEESLDLIEQCADLFFDSRNYVFAAEGVVKEAFLYLDMVLIIPRYRMLRVLIEDNLAGISQMVEEYKDIRHSIYEELDKIEAAVESNRESYESFKERASALVF